MGVQVMKRYAHVENGVVTNVSNWDGEAPLNTPAGVTMVLGEGDPNAEIGATYDGAFHYTPPTIEPTAEEIEYREARLSAVSKLKALGLNDAEIASISGG